MQSPKTKTPVRPVRNLSMSYVSVQTSENNLLVGHHVTSDYVGNVTYFPLAFLDNVGQPRPLWAIFTGRNEVVAKVIFLHLSVIHSVHRVGGRGSASVHAGIPTPPRTSHTTTPPGPGTPPLDQAPPPPQTSHTTTTPPGPGTPPPDQAPPRTSHPPPGS